MPRASRKHTKEPAPETGLSLRVLWDGVLAGWLGGGVVALWFLIFDTARGHPFETPALLSAVLLHGAHNPHITITQGLVFEYTLIHFAAFSIVGVAMAYLMEMAEREPALWISVVIFAFAFEVFFLGFVMFVGPVLMVEISWWSILIGNLLATAAIFTFVLTRHPSIGRGWLKPWLGVLREGVAAGIVGGVVVALWFLVYDLAMGQAFRTPALLGAAIFTGLRNASALEITPALVIGYTIIHFIAFIAFGLAAALIIEASEREPIILLGVLMLFVCFEVIFFGIVTLADSSLLGQLGWWSIALGNVFAASGMLAFFYFRHSGLHVRLIERWASQE